MRLNELLNFDNIVIQCHDNPDADALSSGFALWYYFQKNGKEARFIYRGTRKLTKYNLLMMIERLNIPVEYDPELTSTPDLLVTVDCQYGQSNVTDTEATTIAVIDHHQKSGNTPELTEIRSNLGSCATLIWDMMRTEGIDVNENTEVATALYYGLYTDTNKLTEINHPLDRDLIDALVTDTDLIREMSNSNISLDELKITGKAILGYNYYEKNKCMLIEAEECDPTILGVISDFALEAEKVNICIAYYRSPLEIKFSVRSCSKEAQANEIATFISDGIGGGGGHMFKAGGIIFPEKVKEDIQEYISKKISEYFDRYQIIYAKNTTLSKIGMDKFEKIPQEVGAVKLTKIFPINTPVEIRTLEGDIDIVIEADDYLMIGIEGEIYPIKEAKLRTSYLDFGREYSRTFEYSPTIKNILTKEKKTVIEYANAVVGIGRTKIFARPLKEKEYVKLFTAWDDDKYYSGKPGDYIAVREDDPHDIYVISGELFERLYKPAKKTFR